MILIDIEDPIPLPTPSSTPQGTREYQRLEAQRPGTADRSGSGSGGGQLYGQDGGAWPQQAQHPQSPQQHGYQRPDSQQYHEPPSSNSFAQPYAPSHHPEEEQYYRQHAPYAREPSHERPATYRSGDRGHDQHFSIPWSTYAEPATQGNKSQRERDEQHYTLASGMRDVNLAPGAAVPRNAGAGGYGAFVTQDVVSAVAGAGGGGARETTKDGRAARASCKEEERSKGKTREREREKEKEKEKEKKSHGKHGSHSSKEKERKKR